jgi:tRNA modification GTPase
LEFVHRPYQSDETIAAVATAPGEGGIAVVRLSGKGALEVADKMVWGGVRTIPSHTVRFGKIVDRAGNLVDEGLVLVMRAPRSYTGEDTVEIHCHGGALITRRVLETALSAGARAAGPGEFTFRAFLNGKIDLAQAEAVQELICARNDLALQMAEHQLQGRLSKEIAHFQKELVDIAAILEAWVDFPEEGLEFASVEEILLQLKVTHKKMEKLSATFQEGKILSHGIGLCLSGSPNVGKSSLMNALLGKERAIVTDIPGTTRDLLEEEMRLGTLHFRLVDTAGIRDTQEIVEQEGIRRSRQAILSSDLVLFVLDASRGLCSEDLALGEALPKDKTILIWNKVDIAPPPAHPFPFPCSVALSAKTGEGIDLLKETMHQLIWHKGPPSKEEVYITSARHKQALDQALIANASVIAGLENNASAELVSSDMRKVLLELGSIIGTNVTEDILNAIFSKFCIGK